MSLLLCFSGTAINTLSAASDQSIILDAEQKYLLRRLVYLTPPPSDPLVSHGKADVEFYEELLKDGRFNKFEILENFAQLLCLGPKEVRDEARALGFYYEILNSKKPANNSEKPANKWVFGNALSHLIFLHANSIYSSTKNERLAYQIAREAAADKSLSEFTRGEATIFILKLLQDGPEGIKDQHKAIEMAQAVAADKSLSEVTRGEAAIFILKLLQDGPEGIKDQYKAIEMAQAVAADKSLSEVTRCKATVFILKLLQDGPEGIKDQHKALKLLEDQLEICTKNGDTEVELLSFLANLYLNGDQGVKDIAKAIDIYKKLLDFDCASKFNALSNLILIYSYGEAPYKNLPQALDAHQRLVILSKELQEPQFLALEGLLRFYVINVDSEIFNFAEASNIANAIWNHPKATNATKLNVQVQLSKMHAQHPEKVALAERHQVHHALAHNPMANPIDRGNAFDRLIAVYQLQGNLPGIMVAYEEDLSGAEALRRLDVLNNFIAFLQDPANVVVANPVRLLALIQQRDAVPVLVQLPGLVPGFGGERPIDPYFSPEIIKNRRESLKNLNKDPFNLLSYNENLAEMIAKIKVTIEKYASKDEDSKATAVKATQVFELGNSHPNSYPPIVGHLEYGFLCKDGSKTMRFGEALIRIWARIQKLPEGAQQESKNLFVVQLAAAIDPDGHIVCEIGKLTRLLQVFGNKFF